MQIESNITIIDGVTQELTDSGVPHQHVFGFLNTLDLTPLRKALPRIIRT